MAKKERINFWSSIIPLHGIKTKLESTLSNSEIFTNIEGELDVISGKASIKFMDKLNSPYSIDIQRKFPRYEVSLQYDKCATHWDNFKAAEKCVKKACAGEACIDVYINDVRYGAVPLDHHKL